MHNSPIICRIFVILGIVFLFFLQVQFGSSIEKVKAAITEEEGFDKPTYQSIHKGDMYSTGNVNLGIKVNDKATRERVLYSDIDHMAAETVPYYYNRELIDIDDDPETTNSSKAYISIPDEAEVEWAGLYWSSTRYELTPKEYTAPIKLTIPNGQSVPVTPETTYEGKGLLYGFGINGTYYSNYADVTSLLKSSDVKSGSYTVANIPYPNKGDAYAMYKYSFAGWYMLVITKDKTKTRKSFTVYDGGLKRASGSGFKEFIMKDFLAANTGNLSAKVSTFAVQGDRYWKGDTLQIFSDNKWKEIIDKLNPTNNIFNSTISEFEEHMRDKYPGKFNPDYRNNLGIDANLMNLPEGYIKPGQKEVKLRLGTTGDDHVLNALAFAVNAAAPELVIEKSVVDMKEKYDPGDEVTYRLKVKNIEPHSSSINTTIEDVLHPRLTFVPESVKFIEGPNANNEIDKVDYDEKTRKLTIRIGEGANAIKGGIYTNITPETVVEFKAKVRGRKVESRISNIALVHGIDELTGSKIEDNASNKIIVTIKTALEKIGNLQAIKLANDINGGTLKVGDKVEYTIKAKNSIPDSILKSVKIIDKLPEGVEYVPNTLKINGFEQTDEDNDDSAFVKERTISANISDLKGGEERFITFEVVVKPEMANKNIKNIAVVETDSLEEKTIVEVESSVDPLVGQLEAKKEVTGVVDEKVHVGDEFEYVIKVRNKVENGLIKDMRLTDTLPEGIEYVAGSLKVSDSPVTDAIDEDEGSYDNNTFKASFGDVTDTKEKVVAFKVKVTKEALKKSEIENIAIAEGKTVDNEDLPQERTNVLIKVGSREPKVTKTVSDMDEKEGKKVTLQNKDEEFTWHVNYNFGDNVMNLEKVILQDDIEDVLKVLKVRLVSSGGEEIQVTPQIDEASNGIVIELPKRDGSYNYLENQKYTMHVTSKLNTDTNAKRLEKYTIKEGIPNKAALLFDQKKVVSNEALVALPSFGKIEIEKVDARDENLKLEGAVFELIDTDGNVLSRITTDTSGLATTDPIMVGKYILKEVQAPKGYILMNNTLEIEVKHGVAVQKIKIKNEKSEWIIPETGGIGTVIFYMIGGMLMCVALYVFIKKQKKVNG
nr:isopeptide-forming domain-containing fimbrial protein [Bacillus mobilis]